MNERGGGRAMPDTYTTISGDTWDSIAAEVYGSETKTDWLMRHNPEHISVTKFSSGMTLQTPPIPVKVSANLPPWKRGI